MSWRLSNPSKLTGYKVTVEWKAIKTAERLIEEYMIRIETGCSAA